MLSQSLCRVSLHFARTAPAFPRAHEGLRADGFNPSSRSNRSKIRGAARIAIRDAFPIDGALWPFRAIRCAPHGGLPRISFVIGQGLHGLPPSANCTQWLEVAASLRLYVAILPTSVMRRIHRIVASPSIRINGVQRAVCWFSHIVLNSYLVRSTDLPATGLADGR